ncbi:MAG: gamma-glutamyltransferase, partial [Alphaproteobacteria bacterium]
NSLAQAHRLPTVDANFFIGDPHQFPDLTPSLLTANRIARRARLIKADRNPGLSGSTRLSETPLGMVPAPIRRRLPPTASIVVVDRAGDAVALSLTLTKPFGAGLAARGIILNAASTAFDPAPDRAGYKRANSLRPNARARLEVSPIMALNQDRRLILVAASSGGDNSSAYLAKATTAALRFGKSAEAAISAPNISSSGRATTLEANTLAERLQKPLNDIGHKIQLRRMPSGLILLKAGRNGYTAAADPRGNGTAKSKPPATAGALDSL